MDVHAGGLEEMAKEEIISLYMGNLPMTATKQWI